MKRFSPLRATAVGAILLAGVLLAIYLDARLRPPSEETPLVEIKTVQTLHTI